MSKTKGLISILLCLCLMSCSPVGLLVVGAVAGVGGYTYHQGALKVVYKAPYKETWEASIKAFEDMDLKILKKKHDTVSGDIKSKLPDKRSVTVSISYKTSEETDVKIRVGFSGDEEVSIKIKDSIKKALFD